MKLKPLAAFCRRMGIGLRSGVDILRLLESETRFGTSEQRAAMKRIGESIRSGETLARAMLAEKNQFRPLLIQMVNAAELGGRLDSVFTYMADHYDQLIQTRTFFWGRISWPLIQLVLAVVIVGGVILLQGLLAPSGTPAFDASGLGLAGFGGFITYCIAVTIIFGSLGIAIFGIWKNWFNCHRILMPIVQRIPQLGTALTTLGLSRLSMTLSMLLNAGVEAKRSLKQAFLATGNYYFISGMDRAVECVDRGQSFGEAFDAAEVFPVEFIDAVKTGELSGTETESLDHLATQYQQQSVAALGVIATLASIAIWLMIMLVLAFMIIRMFMNYINMLNSFLP
jgi:type IV pilus assembly protein PilC